MSSGEGATTGPIGNQMAVDDLRELALEAAERLTGRLVFGEFALVVVPSRTSVHRLDPSCEMSALLSERLPLRDRRWRVISPLEISTGAMRV